MSRVRKSVVLAIAITACCAPAAGFAQVSWEFSPYAIRVWLAVDEQSQLSDAYVDQLREHLQIQAKVTFPAVWGLNAEVAPQAVRTDILRRPDVVTDEQVLASQSALVESDKLMIVGITGRRGSWRIAVRELDLHTRMWSRVFARGESQAASLKWTVLELIKEAFSPVARIESVDGKAVVARLRAGGLIRGSSLATIGLGDAMQPVVRRNDRLGEPLKGGITVAPWAICYVEEVAGTELKCTLHSGRSNILGSRNSVRLKRYGMLMRSQANATELRLVKFEQDVNAPKTELVGYDIYEKEINPEDPENARITHLGKSDWRGAIEIEDNGAPFRLLYVRNGGKLMARLPLKPGYQPTMLAEMRDDQNRLEAEAYIRSVESDLMDQVVLRRLLQTYVEKKIAEKDYDRAAQYLRQFQDLPRKSAIKANMNVRQGQIVDEDRRTSRLISKLFNDTEEIVNQYLDPTVFLSLQTQLQNAKDGKPPKAPAAATSSTPAAEPAGAAQPTGSTTPPAGSTPQPAGTTGGGG
ncbi:MAG: hypothetical protein QGG36_23275 [Pirellulaceae bacterium]|jgi:hypothetical protein|nr:hypothetical protein [Pirellulaceae bacterium]MDP7018741.1 hypothetical protein [Pirellulaceae bacterium]